VVWLFEATANPERGVALVSKADALWRPGAETSIVVNGHRLQDKAMGDFETVMKAVDENIAKLRLTVNEAERQALLKRLHKLLAQADRIIQVHYVPKAPID